MKVIATFQKHDYTKDYIEPSYDKDFNNETQMNDYWIKENNQLYPVAKLVLITTKIVDTV